MICCLPGCKFLNNTIIGGLYSLSIHYIIYTSTNWCNHCVFTSSFFQNNQGILALLDEECLRPGNTSDSTFLEKMDSRCESHPHYESRRCKKNQSDKTLPHEAFRLRHYAGNVRGIPGCSLARSNGEIVAT